MCRIKRRGAAAVEFALVAPLFFMLVFGMIELGRAIMVKQVLTNASREGARFAVLDGSTIATTQAKVTTYLRSAGIASGETIMVGAASGSPATVTSKEPSTMADGDPVGVKVEIPYKNISWLPSPFFFNSNSTLSATAVMRRETVQ